MIGPSTNFYVGLEAKHFTMPKGLLYHYSDYARACLGGNFGEAASNAVWLPDVDPDVFQWLWQWLYTGQLNVAGHYYCWELSKDEQLEQTCRLLCQLHILGERLLFDERFLEYHVQAGLAEVIKEVIAKDGCLPLTPGVVEEVLSDSAPVNYESEGNWQCLSLRRFVLRQLSTFLFCTTTDFVDWVECFELDGAFAAELMVYIADEIKWAVKRWGTDIGTPVDIVERKKQSAKDQEISECLERRPRKYLGIWLAMRHMCTFEGCTTVDFRAYSGYFELDGPFAAEVLNYMALGLRWIVEAWGAERGFVVDVSEEKEEEERIAEEEQIGEDKRSFQQIVDKMMRRQD